MSNEIELFQGQKGGGGGSSPPPPTNTPDNLRSEDTVEVVLGLGEGPWFGLERGLKSFFVGDTQLQNESGEYNFQGFTLKFLPGTPVADPVVPVLGGTSANTNVNLTLAYNIPVTRQNQIKNINFIEVRLAISRLFMSNNSGTFTHTLKFRIEYKRLDQLTWTNPFGKDLEVSGKTTSTYVKEYRFAVPPVDGFYEIRITKLTDENTTEKFSDVAWESFQEVITEQRPYNNTAITHLIGKASDQFSSIPQWSGIYKGMLIRVPSNYDVATRTYIGMWDGTFKIEWSDNPAWILYDFVMNDRYGIANYYPTVSLDKYDVYEAAQWCDEKVPNGRGGLQPRYTFNAYLNEARSGLELARYIAGVFNSTIFDDLNGSAYLRVDKDDDACNIFVDENVYDGFEYSYTDITSRYNDITVTFLNPELNWEEDRRRIKDEELIAKNGRVTMDFIAVGCIDAHEAMRRAQYKMITANTETCIVRFRTNRLGQFVSPFSVILISDPDMGYGISGRIKSIDNIERTKIGLRTPVYLEAGVSYDIQFVLADGSLHRTNLTDTLKGYNTELTITAPLPDGLVPEKTVFTIEHPTLIGLPRPFRVTKVEEESGSPDSFTIEAININRNKWYDADNLTDIGVINYSVLPSPLNPPGPSSVNFSERFVPGRQEFQLIVSPVFDRDAYKYYNSKNDFEVWSRLKNSTEAFTQETLYFGDTLINHEPGLYEFKILGKSSLGTATPIELAPVFEFNVTNPKDLPKDIDWARINSREIYWGYVNPPLDFAGFQVRYHNQVGRTTWDDAIRPHQGLITTTSFYTNLIPASARVIMIAAYDAFGFRSENIAIIYREAGDISAVNILEQIDFHPDWDGTLVSCVIEDDKLKANDTGTNLYSNVPTAQLYDGGDFYEASYQEMFYYDTFTVTTPSRMIVAIDFEGSGYEVQISEAGQNIWEPVPVGVSLDAGNYDMKLRVFGGPIRGVISKFSIILDGEDESEDIQDIEVSGTGLVRLPIAKNYSTIKLVSVIIQDTGLGTTAVSYHVMDKDTTIGAGPLIKLLDKDGNVTSGLIDAQVKGIKG